MHPLVLGGAAVLGYFGYRALTKSAAEQQAANALRPGVAELKTGHTYTVQLSIDSPKMGTKDPATAAAVIRSTFEQLGWRVTSTPVAQSALETNNFSSGKASQWVLQGVWTKAEKYMPVGPAWLGMAVAHEAPIAAK